MPVPDWSTWRPASCVPRCFHEAPREGLVRQPANTWSSLAFVAVAALLLVHRTGAPTRAVAGTRPSPQQEPWMRAAVGGALVTTGLGSAFFHASLTFVGQTADVAGMYLLATFTVVYARIGPGATDAHRARREWLAFNGVLVALLIALPELRRWLFAAVLGAGLAMELVRCRRDGQVVRWLGRSVALLGVAFAVWIVDQVAWPFAATSLWQGHALWHLLTAGAAWALWRHYTAPSDRADGAVSMPGRPPVRA